MRTSSSLVDNHRFKAIQSESNKRQYFSPRQKPAGTIGCTASERSITWTFLQFFVQKARRVELMSVGAKNRGVEMHLAVGNEDIVSWLECFPADCCWGDDCANGRGGSHQAEYFVKDRLQSRTGFQSPHHVRRLAVYRVAHLFTQSIGKFILVKDVCHHPEAKLVAVAIHTRQGQ